MGTPIPSIASVYDSEVNRSKGELTPIEKEQSPNPIRTPADHASVVEIIESQIPENFVLHSAHYERFHYLHNLNHAVIFSNWSPRFICRFTTGTYNLKCLAKSLQP